MIKKTWSRKFIAVLVTAAILSVYSMLTLATTGARSGELSVIGDVSVNGQKVTSGGTIFSGSAIVTAKDSSAIVSLGKLGRIELIEFTRVFEQRRVAALSNIFEDGRDDSLGLAEAHGFARDKVLAFVVRKNAKHTVTSRSCSVDIRRCLVRRPSSGAE